MITQLPNSGGGGGGGVTGLEYLGDGLWQLEGYVGNPETNGNTLGNVAFEPKDLERRTDVYNFTPVNATADLVVFSPEEDNSTHIQISLNHAATIASYTLQLGTVRHLREGTMIRVCSRSAVTAFTLEMLSASITVGSLPTSLAAGEVFYLQKLQQGATNSWAVFRTSGLPNGTAANPAMAFAGDPDSGFFWDTNNQIAISLGGTKRGWFLGNLSGLGIAGVGGATLTLGGSGQVEILAGGAAQNITITPSTTGRLITTRLQATHIGTASTGTNLDLGVGTGPSLCLRLMDGGKVLVGTTVDSGPLLQIGTNTTTSSGGLAWGTDVFLWRGGPSQLVCNANLLFNFNGAMIELNGYQIQKQGAQELIVKYGGGNVLYCYGPSSAWTTLSTGSWGWATRSYMASPADGQITFFNAAGTGFTRLNLGPATSSFPSLKRFNAAIHTRLGDDTDYCDLVTKSLTVDNRFFISNAVTPASATAAGTTGNFAWDADYLYICTAANTWRRVAHATW